MKAMKEADVQRGIRHHLRVIGAPHIRHVAGAITRGGRIVARTAPGISDLICCVPFSLDALRVAGIRRVGVFVAIETKPAGWTPPGPEAKAREHYDRQLEFIRMVQGAGGIGFFAPSVETFVRELRLEDHFIS